MNKPTDRLPGGLKPRGLTREQAAAYAGISPTRFDAARKKGEYPPPTLPGGRYDKKLLKEAMDRLSGIYEERGAQSPLDAWRRNA